MNDDYKRGLVTGLAMHPLYVTTGVDIVKFGTHNLLADCTFNSPFSADKNGENVTVNVPANLAVAWYQLTNYFAFKHDYMYKLVAKFKGYGRIGISTTSSNPFTNVGTHTSGTCDDNHLVGAENDSDTALFYVNMRSNTIGDGTQTAGFWFCSDVLYNDARNAHSFQMSLYEEVKG